MTSPRKRLGELLLSLRLIDQDQLDSALASQSATKMPLGSILVDMGYITEELLLNALAAQIGVCPWRIEAEQPDPKAVKKVAGQVSQERQCLPVAIRGDLLLVAMVNPHDFATISLIRKQTGLRVEPVLADAKRLAEAIEKFHGKSAAPENLDELVDLALKDFNVTAKSKDKSAQITETDTRPVVGLVNQVLREAIRFGASDIHIEPRNDRVEVRYRVDGGMLLARQIPPTLLPMLVTRLKIMAELDIVEYRIPQDGRISVSIDGREVDLRVSVLPNYHGQRIVLRILDKSVSLKNLSEIGFSDHNLELFRSLVNKPYGMFLVTGPTGSGKTTTLYAALKELKKSSNNVMTCEDPVEYDIDGVNQSQVNEKVGLTFAKQLRAILRQDPDIVLVGEIRDGETAETAIRAALTGHMVLSTLHCNDAPSSIPRLLDMGIDPYLLGTSLTGVMAQRLLRVLCPHCTSTKPLDPHDADIMRGYGIEPPDLTSYSVGCQECANTGFKGRTAIHELMPVNSEVSKLVASRTPVEAISELAIEYGYIPMQQQALEMVASGVTSMEEAKRVVFLDAAFAGSSLARKIA